MNLPILVQKVYGQIAFTGLYSFEFVDEKNNSISEIFFMMPPKSKTISEGTRSNTVATMGGNYVLDAGNSTKDVTLSGTLYFPQIGSTDNPVASDVTGLQNTLTGLEEYLKLRYMLIRYRDNTLTNDNSLKMPVVEGIADSKINTLFNHISKEKEAGSSILYDKVRIIFHDYDMDDHFYCRVDNMSGTQSDASYLSIEYSIALELYEVAKKGMTTPTINRTTPEEQTDVVAQIIEAEGYDEKFDLIQAQIGYNKEFISTALVVSDLVDDIVVENQKIQDGQTTATTTMPLLTTALINNIDTVLNYFIDTFLSQEQKVLYESGDITIDSLLDRNLLAFYNSSQRLKIQTEGLLGILKAIPVTGEIRYSSNVNDYTITADQFEDSVSVVPNSTNFYYYTVLQGDTARIVALRELKDQEKFINILQINNISESDFIDGALLGAKIKIPIIQNVLSNGSNNFVYDAKYDNIDNYYYGQDIATDINKNIIVSATGDILSIQGLENVTESLLDRITADKGSLNVFNPDFGVISIGDDNAPLLVAVDRYLTDVLEQLNSDPRVVSADIDMDNIDINGEVVTSKFSVELIGGETTEVSV